MFHVYYSSSKVELINTRPSFNINFPVGLTPTCVDDPLIMSGRRMDYSWCVNIVSCSVIKVLYSCSPALFTLIVGFGALRENNCDISTLKEVLK